MAISALIREFVLLIVLAAANRSLTVTAQNRLSDEPEFYCPMDPDVRSKTPGRCPRCGMKLALGIMEPIEYPMSLKITPPQILAGKRIELAFRVADPRTGEPVREFETVHERPFHLFIVSQDLEYFAHEHPQPGADSVFRLKTTLPKPGDYRLLSDFDPKGGPPQLQAKTITAGPCNGLETLKAAKLQPDLAPKQAENMQVELALEPPQPLAGKKTLLFFRVKPADGFEPYLGAWGHMLAASNDLLDMIHTHPSIADGGPQVQFDVFFPREAVYRIWVQFQRKGVVNTARFTVPVSALK